MQVLCFLGKVSVLLDWGKVEVETYIWLKCIGRYFSGGPVAKLRASKAGGAGLIMVRELGSRVTWREAKKPKNQKNHLKKNIYVSLYI